MKQLVCTALGGKVKYANVKEDNDGNLVTTGKVIDIEDSNFMDAMYSFIDHRGGKVEIEAGSVVYEISMKMRKGR